MFDVPWAHSRLRGTGERLLLRQAIRRADALIAVSSFTAERVKARFGRDATVTHLAPSPAMQPPTPGAVAAVRARYGLPDRFVLHVGNIEPRKDVGTLAVACRRAGVPLVLAGARVGDTAVPAGATALGRVPAEDLAPLYGAATVVGYLSRYEGFGLPPLEAMACGAVVLAARATSLPEVLGDAAELVEPGDADAAAARLRDLLHDDDRRTSLATAGRARAASFSWRRTAEETAAVYRTLGLS